MTTELNPKLGFETFLTGPDNELAATAVRRVAEAPGTAYNPLYICGGAGVGKTHLLMASGRMAQLRAAWMKVEYLSLDEFAEAHQAAAAAGQSEAFSNRLASIDFLLLDDIHQLAQRLEVQSSVLHLVSSMMSAGRQVVVAGATAPRDIEGIDSALAETLAAGLVADIEPPAYLTRLGILRRRSRDRETRFEDGVLEAVAEFEITNIRELIGVQNRLVALQAVGGEMIAPAAARALLAGESFPLPAELEERDEQREPAEKDEFADFLADVSVTVQEQVRAWQSSLEEAISKWEQQGYITTRLKTMLEQDTLASVEDAVMGFGRDVEQLASLRAAMATLDQAASEDPVFYDPDRVAEARALVEERAPSSEPADLPSSSWTFESHVAGESNLAAREAARAVIAAPGTAHNPLVLVGPTGVGKTHLLHAIGNELSSVVGSPVICYAAQRLLDMVTQGKEEPEMRAWRARFEQATALLVDNVNLVLSDAAAQQELANLLATFVDSGRQVVVTLNAKPEALDQLIEPLRLQIGRGNVVEISPPDRELRRVVVSRMLRERLGSADRELADYLADRPAESLRTVIGTVQRIIATAESDGTAVSAALARELTQGSAPRMRRPSSPRRTSGILTSPTGGVRSNEKVIWTWPNPGDRLIEELG